MRRKKAMRPLALFLAFVLCIGMLPMAALAENADPAVLPDVSSECSEETIPPEGEKPELPVEEESTHSLELVLPEGEDPIAFAAEPAGLLHYYKFDERSGDAYADSSENVSKADGAKNGFVGSAKGRNGKAISLDGSGCVQVDSAAFKDLTAFTVTAWINWDGSLDATNTIFSGHGDWFHVRKENGNDKRLWVNFFEGEGKWTDLGREGARFVPANEWVHVAYVKEADSVSLYMDGELMGIKTDVVNPPAGDGIFHIGGNGVNGGKHPFHGLIDEVRIYASSLTKEEIEELVAIPADIISTIDRTDIVLLPDVWGEVDVTVPIAFGEGDSVDTIRNGETVLDAGTDYTINETGIVLKKEYIAGQSESFTLDITFTLGSEAVFTVIKAETVIKEYIWTPEKGGGEWTKLFGDGTFAMEDDGMRITGEVALLNTAAPTMLDGEIEITFDQKRDDSYLGFLFRCDDDADAWQAVRNEYYNKWRFTDSTGARIGVYGDGSSLVSRDGEADTKLKIRFENGVISLWIDDQFMVTNAIKQAGSASGGVGLYTQSGCDMVVKKVTFRSVPLLILEEDDSGDKTITAGDMTVTLADDFPRVKKYTLNGKTLMGAEFKYNYVTINSVNYPATATISGETDKSITYTVTPEGGAAETFDVVYTIQDGNILDMRINNIEEKSGELAYSMNLPNQPIISVNNSQTGAALDASTFTPALQGEGGDWDQTNMSDEHFTIAENKLRKSADMMATLAFVTTDELSASITNNVLYNVRELRYRAFDLPSGGISAGVWNSEFAYRGLDGAKLFPIASEPDEEDLYCRVILTEDTNGDGQMDWQDGANALKILIGDRVVGGDKAARSFFHVGYNFASGAQQPFLKVGDNLKRLSNLIDGFDQILVFKGYANEGHDSGHSDFDDISVRGGGVEDLNAMTDDVKGINATFGIHINHSECYPEAKMFNDHTMADLNGWAWMDQSKQLRRDVDILNTREGQRNMDERLDSMFEKAPGIDFVYVDTYNDDRWAETRLADNLIRNGAMIGTENKIDFDRYASWVHHPGISADSIHHFVYNTQKDIYASNDLFWSGYGRGTSFMSWQHQNNINSILKQFYTEQLPQKYLMCHDVRKTTDSRADFEGNVYSTRDKKIYKDGCLIADNNKIFIPWFAEDSTTRNPDEAAKIYHWNGSGGETTWTLPAAWSALSTVKLYQTTQNGKRFVTDVAVRDGQVTISARANTPYVVYPGEAAPDVTEWSVGSPIKDTSFKSRDFSIWQKAGGADIAFNDDGNGVSILTMTGKETGQVSQTMTGLIPNQKYRVLVYAGAENGKTARLTVEDDGAIYENYIEQIKMNCNYFDNYALNKPVQLMWVDFVASAETAVMTLSADACKAENGKATFMETRIVKTAEPDLPEGYVANETFEFVEQGAYGIFNPERADDGNPHLSETHTPYTDDTIAGNWSIKMSGVSVRTSPATMRLAPNTEYTMEFDTLGNGKVSVQSESDDTNKPLDQDFSAGHSKLTFTTGAKADYVVRIERSRVLDNFQVYVETEIEHVTGINMSKSTVTLNVSGTEALAAVITPENASNKAANWSTDNSDVATVDQNGVVTAMSTGTATITVTTVDGGFTARCTVTVKAESEPPVDPVVPGVTRYTIKAGAGEGGSITPAGSVPVERNASKTFAIKADADYVISNVLVDGASVGAVESYTFEKVTRAHTITAEFRKADGAAEGGFADVAEDAWYADAVAYVTERGLFNGVGGGRFAPMDNMTRAMFFTVLHRMSGEDTGGTGESWYSDAMKWAVTQGISDGAAPEANITREQLAAMLYRYAKAEKTQADLSGFTDSGSISHWAADAMSWAVAEGIITGKSGGKLDPSGFATRAEVATILRRFIENSVK